MAELKPQSRNILRFHAFYNHWQNVRDALPVLDDHQAELSWVEPELASFEVTNSSITLHSIGYNISSMLNLYEQQSLNPAIPDDLKLILRNAAAKGSLTHALLPFHNNGDYKLLEVVIAPFLDAKGKQRLLMMAEPLFSPEASLNRSLDAMWDGVLFFYPRHYSAQGHDTLVTAYMNQQAATTLNCVRTAMIGKPANDILKAQLGSQAFALLSQAYAGHEVNYSFMHETEQASKQWLKLSLKPMLGGVIASLSDISNIKTLQSLHKQAESDLQTQVEIYRKLVENSADHICRYTLDGKITFANPSFAKLHNMQAEQLKNKNLFDILKKPEAEQMRLQIAEFKAGHPRTEYEQGMSDGNARRRRIHWQDQAIFNAQGQVIEVQSVGRDISLVNQRQIALRRLSALAMRSKSSPETPLAQVLTIGLDLFQMDNGLIAEFDNQAFTLLACKGAGTPDVGVAVPMQMTVCQRMAQKNEAIAFHNRSQARLIGIDDSVTPGYQGFIGAPVFVSGKLYGTINFKSVEPMRPFVDEDISFVKLLASFVSLSIERENQQKIIDARNKHFQHLFRDAPVMLQTVDRHGKLISVSGAWSEMMGYADDPKAPLGQPLNHFLSPETPMPFPVEAVSREAGAQWEGQTYHWQRRNGSSFEGEVSGICFDDPISNKKLFLMVITDVTARNQAMAQLQNANLSLADVNEKLRSFAYIASHDLQEPLRKLRSFAGHLRAELDGSLSEEAEFCLHAIERSALRLSDMVSDLLTFSREGNRELSLQDIDFDELLANIIQDLSLTADEADFSIKVEGSLGRLQADSNATRHLLQNILHNAIKYRDFNKKPELKVRISDTDYGKIIEFEDNGIGFEAAAKDKIFQPFLRLHGKSDRPGSGIGLAICKTVAERHGWKIAAHGIPNQGAVFSLTIPRTHQKEDHYK